MKRLATILSGIFLLSIVGIAPVAATDFTPATLTTSIKCVSPTTAKVRVDFSTRLKNGNPTWQRFSQRVNGVIQPAIVQNVKGWGNREVFVNLGADGKREIVIRYALGNQVRNKTKNVACGNTSGPGGPGDPEARIIGPKADPYFRYVLDNRDSNRPVTFIVQPWDKKVTVPGQCVYKTGWHYENPFSTLTVKRGNGTLLAKRGSGPGGWYGPLYKGYHVGLTC